MTEVIFDENEDWEKRVLCSDGSCIGTIGPDGKCKECGRVYEGEISAGHGKESVQAVMTQERKSISSGEADLDEDWDTRVLCSDESCIGIIGADGKCKECGKPL